MEFWGVEVKAGEPIKVQPDFESLIHVSQAALGESKKDKGNDSVLLFLNIDGKKMVLGTLNGQNIPQLSFDLVFEKEFELSHNLKNGSVYFCGYQTPMPDDGPNDFYDEDDSEDEDELVPLGGADNGESKLGNAKPVAAKATTGKPEAAKPKAKAAEPKKDIKSKDDSDEEDSEEEESDEDESGEDSEEGMSVDGESDDSEDESDSEDEETPKKTEPSKKRPNDSATKTPVSVKKQKAATPQKSDSKKPAQQTPHPAKKGGKGVANGNKSQSPKSAGGHFSCTPCRKSFGLEAGLQAHSKAKHGAK